MKRKLLSLFLAMTLLLSCIPIPAFASEVEQNEAGAELQSAELSTLDSIYDPVTNSVTVTNVPAGAIVTVGGYMNGQMAFVEMAEEHTGTVSWNLPDVKFDTLKVFGLDENYAPVCASAVIQTSPPSEEVIAKGTCGRNVTWVLDVDGTLTIKGSGAMKDYDSASTPWYSYKYDIRAIVIQEGVTSIGSYAFDGFRMAEQITIPDSITSIGTWAFRENYVLKHAYINSLESWLSIAYSHEGSAPLYSGGTLYIAGMPTSDITLPKGMTSVPAYAFYGCTSLKNVIIPAGVAQIDDSAFRGCTNLTCVTMPEGMTSIGNNAFKGCTNLTEPDWPSSLKTIGNYAFNRCNGLIDVTLPENIIGLGTGAFEWCANMESIVLPEGLTNLGRYTFYDCAKLTEIRIPSSVLSIGDYVFYGCTALSNVNLPETMTRIGVSAFKACSSLTSINLPKNITYINSSAFADCAGLVARVEGDSYAHGWCIENNVSCKIATIAATEVTLNKTILLLNVGETATLIATVSPSDAANKAVNWTTSASSVAAVNSNGVVTATGAGTATITATAADGSGKSASCTVTVSLPACDHTDTGRLQLGQTFYNQISGDGEKHQVEKHYRVTCNTCGETINSDLEEWTTEAHNFNQYGQCTKCQYQVEINCDHVEVSRVQVGNPSCTQVTGNETNHQMITHFVEKCDNCRAIVTEGITETSFEAHEFDLDGVCELCGYEKCLHADTIKAYIKTTYTQIADNAAQHQVMNYYEIVCENCEEIINPNYTESLLANHTFDNANKCTLCSYEKPQEKVELVAPVLIHPTLSTDEDDMPAYTEDDMTLVWGAVEGAVKYTVRMDEYWDDEWDEEIKDKNTETTETTFTIPEIDLYEGGMFRVRITAYGADGESTHSDWHYFQVGSSSYIWVKDELEVDYDADDYSISVCTSSNWKASVSESWISISSRSGFASCSLDIEVTENKGDFPRIGTISFTNNAGGYALLTLVQEGNGSGNEGKIRIDYPEQGETVDYDRIDVEWTDKTNTSEYYTVELYDLTSNRTAYTQNMTTAEYDYIPKSKLTQGHIYRLTVAAYNVQRVELAQASIVFKLEGEASGSGSDDSDDEVIEVPDVPVGSTEILYSGIVNNSKVDKKDINVSWQEVIGADYYAVALRDMTLYPDGTPETNVQKVINTKTQNLNYTIFNSELVYGHTYRLWIAAHKNDVNTAINGKNIIFTVENVPLKWTAKLEGDSKITVNVSEGSPDANTPYLFIAEDSDGRHYPGNSTPNISAGATSATFKTKALQMKRAKAYDLYVLPADVSLTANNRSQYSAGRIVLPLWGGNMIAGIRSDGADATSTKKLYLEKDIEIDWEGSYGVYNVEVTAALNGQIVFTERCTDPVLIDGDDPVTTTIDSSRFSNAEAGDKLEIIVTVTPTPEAQALLVDADLEPTASSKPWVGTFAEQLTELDLALTNDSAELNPYLATASVWYAMLAYGQLDGTGTPVVNGGTWINRALTTAGFEVLTQQGYDKPDSDSYVGYTIARKKIHLVDKEISVYSVVIRGTTDTIEWVYNFDVGSGYTHFDFNANAVNIYATLMDYINLDTADIINVWTTGHSRGAAIGNLLAAKCCNNSRISQTYAYLYAVPAVSTNYDSNLPIYNYIDRSDLIPMLPMDEWGYGRNGKDIYFGTFSGEVAAIPDGVFELVNGDKALFLELYNKCAENMKESLRKDSNISFSQVIKDLGYGNIVYVLSTNGKQVIVTSLDVFGLAITNLSNIVAHHEQKNYIQAISSMY